LEEIQTENMKLKVENQKLGRRMETIRTDNQTILDLESVGPRFLPDHPCMQPDHP
jgi:regulator of replication initiation timing